MSDNAADFSEDYIVRLAIELRDAKPVTLSIPALDAYGIVGIVQFAWRNPQLDAAQKQLVESFARGLQAALAERAPLAGASLELGWDVTLDRKGPPTR
jgi:hypothetical protein